MKRYLFMWGINIAFLLVGFACKRDLNMNYKTKFQWTLSISAPRNYPVEQNMYRWDTVRMVKNILL